MKCMAHHKKYPHNNRMQTDVAFGHAADARRYLKEMKINAPKFTLKQDCPICEQGESLIFLTCSKCNSIILACDEDGSLFPDPKNLEKQGLWTCDPLVTAKTKCPYCEEVGFFSFSSGEEIKNLGFTSDQYE